VDALPKGDPQGADGAREASESSPFQSAAAFLAKIREQGIGASRAGLSLSGWVRSIPTPSALNWLKSSVENMFGNSQARTNRLTIKRIMAA
jgi:hypothetical protein